MKNTNEIKLFDPYCHSCIYSDGRFKIVAVQVLVVTVLLFNVVHIKLQLNMNMGNNVLYDDESNEKIFFFSNSTHDY